MTSDGAVFVSRLRRARGGALVLLAAKEFKRVPNHGQLALFLLGLLVLPLLQPQSSLYEDGISFLEILRDHLTALPEKRHVNEGHFLAFLTSCGGVVVIDRESELRNGVSACGELGFGIAGEVGIRVRRIGQFRVAALARDDWRESVGALGQSP